MGKPFRLTFEFTPAAFGNRQRTRDEQFTVTIRDLAIMRRLEWLEKMTTEAPDIPEVPKDHKQTTEEALAMLAATKKQTQWKIDFAKKHTVRVSNLTVIGADSEEVEVKTAEQLEEFCADALQEIADRLLFGAGEEELKNSQSPSSAASSATEESGNSTSIAAATEK